MIQLSQIINTLLLISALLAYAGCSDDNPTDSPESFSKVQGRINGNGIILGKYSDNSDNVKIVEGASVVLLKLDNNGEAQVVSREAVKTDENGKFTLETSLDGVNNLIIKAIKGGDEWRAVLASEVKTGITVYSQPADNETTMEAEIYEEVSKGGGSKLGYTDVAILINSDIAAAVDTIGETRTSLIDALDSEAETEYKAFVYTDLGGKSDADWQNVLSAKSDAQVKLERDLYYAENEINISAAYNSFYKSIITGFVDAGVSASTYAKILEVSHKKYSGFFGEFDTETGTLLYKQAAALKARVVDFAIQSECNSLDISQERLNTILTAGLELNSNIQNSGNKNELRNSFLTYRTKVYTELKKSFGSFSNSMSSLETLLDALKLEFNLSANSQTSADVLINSYVDFYNQAAEKIAENINLDDETQLKAITEIFIMLNLTF